MADSLIAPGTPPPSEPPPSTPPASGEGGVDVRPDWLPEKFWVDGKPAYDKLAASYGEIERTLGGKQEQLRESIKAELTQAQLANRPEKPELYKLPEIAGLDQTELAEHPITQWWRQFSHDKGFSQDDFQKGIGLYIEAAVGAVPDPVAEMTELGENAKARTEAVGLFVYKNFEPDELPAIEKLCSTAAGVRVVEKMMKLIAGEGGTIIPPTGGGEELTLDKVKVMMQDKRYWKPGDRDPTFVKQVEDFFKRAYPETP